MEERKGSFPKGAENQKQATRAVRCGTLHPFYRLREFDFAALAHRCPQLVLDLMS